MSAPGAPPSRAEIAAHLAATRLFGELEPPSLSALADIFHAERLRPGQAAARQGQVDESLWVVLEGDLQIDHQHEDGTVEVLSHTPYARVIGTRGIFTGEARTTSVVAQEPSLLLRAEREALWAALAEDLDAAEALVLPEEARRRLAARNEAGSVQGEFEVGLYRRHWIVLVQRMLLPGLVLGVCLALAALFSALLASAVAIALLATLGIAIPLLFAVWAFFDYFNDKLVVTSRRVIHYEDTPLIDAERIEAPLARIQDIQVTMPSLLSRLLGYGTLQIQTAGSPRGIVFTGLPWPEDVRDTIFEEARKAREVARSEHDTWIERRVREALGMGEVAGAPPTRGAGTMERHAVGEPLWRSALLYFWPRQRVQVGTEVTWRKHPWVLFRSTWLWGLLWVGLSVWLFRRSWAAAVAMQAGAEPLVPLLPTWLLWGAWLLLFLVLLYLYEDWRNDYYMLTDEHIVDVEALPLGLFADQRKASLARIQDIRYAVPNPIATILHFGSVTIETASDAGNFTFDDVYRPEVVQQEIFARMDGYQARAQAREEERQAAELARWISAYHRVAGEEDGEEPPEPPPSPRLPGAYPEDAL